ncbi:MAG: thrombospondin type 3 repeat-containing protein [Deltaproteobacteria bacterium]|nr:thrombospondin type 3 repeat-containing protein [Deltaproteobacteria bacterium]
MPYRTHPGKPDSDGDAMNDGWEIAYGTDPRVDNADDDLDGDGISNLDEFIRQTQSDNQRPNKPLLMEPGDETANVALVSVLRSDLFTDPDIGDLHAETRWQISSDTEFSDLVLDLQSANFLTQLPLLDYMLDATAPPGAAPVFGRSLGRSRLPPPSSSPPSPMPTTI